MSPHVAPWRPHHYNHNSSNLDPDTIDKEYGAVRLGRARPPRRAGRGLAFPCVICTPECSCTINQLQFIYLAVIQISLHVSCMQEFIFQTIYVLHALSFDTPPTKDLTVLSEHRTREEYYCGLYECLPPMTCLPLSASKKSYSSSLMRTGAGKSYKYIRIPCQYIY